MAFFRTISSTLRNHPRAAVVGLALGLDLSCKAHDVGFHVGVPSEIGADVAWIEIGAFAGAKCSAVAPMLPSGIPNGATTHIAFQSSDPAGPVVGDLPRKSYAFAAVAKNATCGTVATGCAEGDLGSLDNVDISLKKLDSPSPSCDANTTCRAAQCVPTYDNANPDLGAHCSLELVGAGPLPTSAVGIGAFVSAPAIVPTAKGFVIAYRESATYGGPRLTILPIDSAGGAGDPTRPRLDWTCSDKSATDGTGLVVSGNDGQMVTMRPECDAKRGPDLVSFTVDPLATKAPWNNPAPQHVALSFGHVAANRPGSQIIAYTLGGAPRVATIQAERGVVEPFGTFGGTSNMTGAWLATSDKVLALLAASTSSVMQLVVAPVDTPLTSFDANKSSGTGLSFPGLWGVPAAEKSRVIVLTKDSGKAGDMVYRTFDANTSSVPAATVVENAQATVVGDAVLHNDRAFFALLRPGEVELAVFDQASTKPTPLRRLALSSEPRTSFVSAIRDGKVAVTATDTRVAVTWTTTANLSDNDGPGGYAVFACTP